MNPENKSVDEHAENLPGPARERENREGMLGHVDGRMQGGASRSSAKSDANEAETASVHSTESQPKFAALVAEELPAKDKQLEHEGTELTAQASSASKFPSELGYADFGLCLLSALLFILDYTVNLFIFQKYYQLHKHHNHYVVYFYLTIAIILTPPLVTALFEIVWYKEEKIKYGKSLKWHQWIVRIILMVLLLGPAFRYVEILMHANKTTKTDDRREKQNIVKKSLQMKEDADFLYMLEKFTESGLHIVLQMFIVKKELAGEDHEEIGAGEALKIIMAILLMPYTVTVFVRSQRQADEDANNMSSISTVIQFIWRLFIIISQAVCLSLFLALYPFAFMITSIATWGLMAIWVFLQGTDFCRQKMWLEYIFRFFIAYVYLFTFFNVTVGESYYKALFYYSFMFLQRGLMMCFWCQGEPFKTWYRWPALAGFFLFFCTGIAIQLLYYGFHHPTRPAPKNLHKKLLAIDNKPKLVRVSLEPTFGSCGEKDA